MSSSSYSTSYSCVTFSLSCSLAVWQVAFSEIGDTSVVKTNRSPYLWGTSVLRGGEGPQGEKINNTNECITVYDG